MKQLRLLLLFGLGSLIWGGCTAQSFAPQGIEEGKIYENFSDPLDTGRIPGSILIGFPDNLDLETINAQRSAVASGELEYIVDCRGNQQPAANLSTVLIDPTLAFAAPDPSLTGTLHYMPGEPLIELPRDAAVYAVSRYFAQRYGLWINEEIYGGFAFVDFTGQEKGLAKLAVRIYRENPDLVVYVDPGHQSVTP